MRKYFLFIGLLFLLACSCSSSKTSGKPVSKADKVVAHAMQFKGVGYRYGGITKRGMDCSGVVYTAFAKENIQLPRISRNMAKLGKKISLKRVEKGDLLFFDTSKRSRRISHVGLVVSNIKGQIRFIHATTSRGVIVSSMSEKYWKNTFKKATKIL